MDYTITLPYLRAWRKAARLSINDLAYVAGVTASTISRAEHGGVVQLGTAHKLADGLGVEKCELVNTPPDGRALVGVRALPVTEDADGLWFSINGGRVRSMRQAKAMSKYHLARRAGLPASTIRALEADETLLAARDLEALAVALEVGQLELLMSYVPRSQRVTRPDVEPLHVHPRTRRRWLLAWAASAAEMGYPHAAKRFRRQAARLAVELDDLARQRSERLAVETEMRRALAERIARHARAFAFASAISTPAPVLAIA